MYEYWGFLLLKDAHPPPAGAAEGADPPPLPPAEAAEDISLPSIVIHVSRTIVLEQSSDVIKMLTRGLMTQMYWRTNDLYQLLTFQTN